MLFCGSAGIAIAAEDSNVLYLQSKEEGPEHYERFAAEFAIRIAPHHPGVRLERRNVAAWSFQEMATLLAAIGKRPPAALVTAHTAVAQAALRELPNVPVVLLTLADPVNLGVVDVPLGSNTNVTGYTFSVPFEMKHLEILKQSVPSVRRVGVISDTFWADGPVARRMLDEAPAILGVSAKLVSAQTVEQLDQIPASAGQVDAWFVPDTPFNRVHAARIVAHIRASQKPSIGGSTSHLTHGGLLVYEPVRIDPWPRMADMVRLILAGVPARRIPFDRPKLFRLAVNRAAAFELGVELPKSILKRADEIR